MRSCALAHLHPPHSKRRARRILWRIDALQFRDVRRIDDFALQRGLVQPVADPLSQRAGARGGVPGLLLGLRHTQDQLGVERLFAELAVLVSVGRSHQIVILRSLSA
jgi:hypothetical protein